VSLHVEDGDVPRGMYRRSLEQPPCLQAIMRRSRRESDRRRECCHAHVVGRRIFLQGLHNSIQSSASKCQLQVIITAITRHSAVSIQAPKPKREISPIVAMQAKYATRINLLQSHLRHHPTIINAIVIHQDVRC
jgi:hypothetical protein